MKAFWALLWLELLLALKSRQSVVSLLFYLIVVLIFPFAIGPDRELIASLGPAILWIGALFSSLFGLDRLFGADADDGSIDHFRLSRLPLPVLVLTKALVLWLTVLFPLVIATPLLAMMLALESEALLSLIVALVLGTPALSLLGTLVAALMAGFRRSGLIMPVLALPFSLPILIFGSALSEASAPMDGSGPIWVLISLNAILLVLTPVIGAKALELGQG